MSCECILADVLEMVHVRPVRSCCIDRMRSTLMWELRDVLLRFERDEAIGCVVITGRERAFSAGADISAMATCQCMDVYKSGFISRNWETIRQVRKPVIAAVAGLPSRGLRTCDNVGFAIAADTARFGQPEVKLGAIPGPGGHSGFLAPSARARPWTCCSRRA